MNIIEKKSVELESFEQGKVTTLTCPRCSESGCLHQQRVFTWFRNEEDSVTGTFVVSDKNTTYSNDFTEQGGNPSERRDGLTIEFTCEFCSGDVPASHPCDRVVLYLDIVQHKGHTLMSWKYHKRDLWG
jgi:hypothetical protein